MDGYNFSTLLDLSPVSALMASSRFHSDGGLPWWRGASEGMWALLLLVVIGACSFAAIILSSRALIALAGV